MIFDLWLFVGLGISLISQTIFVIVYSLPFFGAGEWWKDIVGRSLFYRSTASVLLITAFFGFSAINFQEDNYDRIRYNTFEEPFSIWRFLAHIAVVLFIVATYSETFSLIRSRLRGKKRTSG